MSTSAADLATSKRWYAANKEAVNARRRVTRAARSDDAVAREKATKDAWNEANRGKRREFGWATNIKAKFGISRDDYGRMLSAQGGVCAICNQPPTKHRLAVDHDHASGRVRGLLHNTCNAALGALRDSVAVLDSAKSYLIANGPDWSREDD